MVDEESAHSAMDAGFVVMRKRKCCGSGRSDGEMITGEVLVGVR